MHLPIRTHSYKPTSLPPNSGAALQDSVANSLRLPYEFVSQQLTQISRQTNYVKAEFRYGNRKISAKLSGQS
jgi:hypothetical protein